MRLMVCLLAVLVIGAVVPSASARETVSLDGEWRFRMDPENKGEPEKWFSGMAGFDSPIRVPGAWDAQGFGAETEKVHHNFVGVGWYARKVDVPAAWAGKRVFLCLRGVHRASKTWVNGRYLGEHIGYLTPVEYEITQIAQPGSSALVVVAVDSVQHWDRDGLYGCIDILDEMDIPWGGLWGHVSVEAREAAWLEDVYVHGDVDAKSARITAAVKGDPKAYSSVRVEVLGADGGAIAEQTLRPGEDRGTFDATIEVPSPMLWSPNHPYLYAARISVLNGGTVLDTSSVRFGMRKIEVRGTGIYLNGNRFFLAGYGDDAIYPETMSPPLDEDFYLNRLKTIKKYGFNGVRHHSHFLPDEYYDACDEAGILVQPELPVVYEPFYKKAQGDGVASYKRAWIAAIKRFRNHPCIFGWCMGNELSGNIPHNQDLYDTAKALDPGRLVIDTDGLFGDNWLLGEPDRPTLDYYMYQFDVWNIPLDRPDKYAFKKSPPKPVISHETGNFGSFPSLDQIELFKHNFKPFWLTAAKEKIEKSGLFGELDRFVVNSQRLYYLCHKLDIENLRKNPEISGHHWWLFQDYWTGSNGLVDTYFRPKAPITAEQVRRFVNDVVLLEEGLGVAYTAGDPIRWSFLVSNYGEGAIEGATLKWQAVTDTGIVAGGSASPTGVAQGSVSRIIDAEALVKDIEGPVQLKISAALSTPAGDYSNEWTTWVYPTETATTRGGLYAPKSLIDSLRPYGAQPMPPDSEIPEGAVCVGRFATRAMAESVARGATLVLLKPEKGFDTISNRFKTTWWVGSKTDNNVGTVVYDNPVCGDMAPEGWCDQGWYSLLEGATAYVLNGYPSQPDVMVRAIDTYKECRNKALLFEARVGRGRLIVCGLNVLQRDNNRSEARWLLGRLIEYAGTKVAGGAELPLDFLMSRTREPIEGDVVEGFERLLNKEGCETGSWYSYRQDGAVNHICRQRNAGARVEWETAPWPVEAQGKTAKFAFAGGLGWITEPEVGGFTFGVNGKPVLDFDIKDSRATWESADKKVRLDFIPKRKVGPDTLGMFCLSLAPDLVTPGKPVVLSVESRKGGSQRWFALNPYTDAVPDLLEEPWE